MGTTRCKYASKPCLNDRSLKNDGSAHRLCAMHREKAKDAQRRWHARQRRNTGQGAKVQSNDRKDARISAKRRRVEPLEPADCGSPVLGALCQFNVEAVRVDSPASVELAPATSLSPFDPIDWIVHNCLAEGNTGAQLDDLFFEDLGDWCPAEACAF